MMAGVRFCKRCKSDRGNACSSDGTGGVGLDVIRAVSGAKNYLPLILTKRLNLAKAI
jgi:hypothetical protein